MNIPSFTAPRAAQLEDMPGSRFFGGPKPIAPGDFDEEQAARAETGRQGLSQRLGVEADEVKVLSYQEASFSDSRLGITVRGGAYAPARREGFIVQLEVGEQKYSYRSTAGREEGKYARAPGEGDSGLHRLDSRGMYVPIQDTGRKPC